MDTVGTPAADRNRVVFIGLLVEALLFLVFLLWAWFRGASYRLWPNAWEFSLGVCFALGLACLNVLLLELVARKSAVVTSLSKFVDTIVYPLVKMLGPGGGLLISIAAGVGEEAFFRGFLQSEVGLIFASFLFSVLHFGSAVRLFPWVAVLYFLIGLLFGLLYEKTGSLGLVIVAHAVYDYIAVLYLLYFYKPRTRGTASVRSI